MERVDLKYQIWSESTKERLVFEDKTWSNKWALMRRDNKKWDCVIEF